MFRLTIDPEPEAKKSRDLLRAVALKEVEEGASSDPRSPKAGCLADAHGAARVSKLDEESVDIM